MYIPGIGSSARVKMLSQEQVYEVMKYQFAFCNFTFTELEIQAEMADSF